MDYVGRDYDIDRIFSRKERICTGMGLGIIVMDEVYPGFPGDVRNPSAFPYPIQYEIAEGLNIENFIRDEDIDKHFPKVLRAAKKLEKVGCRAIMAECGYFSYFQKEISESVDVPVFLSSLLQVPWAQSVIGSDKVVGILISIVGDLREKHLQNVGIVPGTNYVLGDVMGNGKCPEFHNLWNEKVRGPVPGATYKKAEADFIEQGVAFFEQHPNMGAMVLECTGFPPFARALQRIIDIPVFSWGTLMDYAYLTCVHRDYYGHV